MAPSHLPFRSSSGVPLEPVPPDRMRLRWQAAQFQEETLMMTKENTHPNKKFMADLERAGVDVTSGIARQALDDFRRGVSADQAIATAVSRQNTAMQLWVSTALEPWCNRHGITLEQGLSIAFDDSPFNPKTKKDDLPTMRNLFEWNGQQNTFAWRLMNDMRAQTAKLPAAEEDPSYCCEPEPVEQMASEVPRT